MPKRMIFVSYSRKDEDWEKKLLSHLGVLRHHPEIEVWNDRVIATGSDWQSEIDTAIDQSMAAVLLISPDFFSSDYIRSNEVIPLLRASFERGLKIFPVIVRKCAWQDVEWLSRLQIANPGSRPLAECSEIEVDAVFARLASDLKEFLLHSPARLPGGPAPLRTNLPAPTTSFVGRRRELEALRNLLAEETIRLVTVTGSPGMGKTRLSQQLGRELLDHFPGGCWFVNLIDAVTIIGIGHAITQALNLSSSSGYMTPQEGIVELIRPRGPLLLILDNFEQVVDFAGETVGYWLEKLPDIKFLVTSREVLNLLAEREYRLEPLTVPPVREADSDSWNIQGYESVKLFVDRARQLQQDFRLDEAGERSVARICSTLQGIPLAIELAAAQTGIFSLEQIADKLGEKLRFLQSRWRDRPDRQRTLYSSIDWSYQLLKPWEQHAFLQICIFRGDFFLEAAESIVDLAGFEGAPPVADVVRNLCNKSLLNAHHTRYGPRFDMYVAIQDYGQETWQKVAGPAEQEALARRWAGYYIPYAQAWNAKVHSADGGRALDRLSLELENLFGIQHWFLKHGMPEIAAEAILAFAETMAVRGPAHLRVPRLEMSLAQIGEGNQELRMRLMTSLSAAHWSLGQWNECMELADGAVGLLTERADSPYAAAALRQQGRIRIDRGYLRRALSSLERAKEISSRLGDRTGISVIEGDMAGAYDRLGDLRKALALLEEAEKLVREVDDDAQRALVLNRRGLALWHHGYASAALACFEEAEALNLALGATGWIGAHRTNQGLALADLDEFERAFELFESSEKIHRQLGNQAWAAVNYGGWGRALLMRGEPGDLERGLELILKAEGLSRKVYYPENISLHAGDRGKGLFLLGRMTEARKAVREAVAIERIIGASKDLRHFGNLVFLARIEEALGNHEECREAALRAGRLKRRLGIDETHDLRRVREVVANLAELEGRLAEREEPEKRISWLLARHARTPLSADELERIDEAMLRAYDESGYEYPWTGVEQEVKSREPAVLRLFAYGSLLNEESARRLFPDARERMVPAIAFGVVRLFNFEMPDAVRVRYEILDDPLERGLLNAEVTGFRSDIANGVLLDVGLEHIELLRIREVGYDLRPIICIHWEEGVPTTPVPAYILSCPNRLWKGRPLTNPGLRAHRDYLTLCYEGAASFSESFAGFWLDTTFLGDGETRVTRELPG